MNATGIREGDIVRIDVRGAKGIGLVKRPVHHDEKLHKRVVELEPLMDGYGNSPYLPTRFVTPRQITGHWRKARATSNGG